MTEAASVESQRSKGDLEYGHVSLNTSRLNTCRLNTCRLNTCRLNTCRLNARSHAPAWERTALEALPREKQGSLAEVSRSAG